VDGHRKGDDTGLVLRALEHSQKPMLNVHKSCKSIQCS
jgi:hypothetical protein